jgi:hypothetical protein
MSKKEYEKAILSHLPYSLQRKLAGEEDELYFSGGENDFSVVD